MTDITLEVLTKRHEELKNAQLEALAAISSINGRMQECELMMQVLDQPVVKLPSKEEAPRVPLGEIKVAEELPKTGRKAKRPKLHKD